MSHRPSVWIKPENIGGGFLDLLAAVEPDDLPRIDAAIAELKAFREMCIARMTAVGKLLKVPVGKLRVVAPAEEPPAGKTGGRASAGKRGRGQAHADVAERGAGQDTGGADGRAVDRAGGRQAERAEVRDHDPRARQRATVRPKRGRDVGRPVQVQPDQHRRPGAEGGLAAESWRDERDALARLADDGCPHCGEPAAPRLMPEEAAALLAQWDRLLWRIAQRWKRSYPDMDLDDLYAEARAGFVEAAGRFDPARGYSFPAYADHYARKWLHAFAAREAARGVHVPQYQGVTAYAHASLSAPVGAGDGRNQADFVAAREPEAAPEFPPDFWARVEKLVTALEFRVLWLYFREGLTHRAIGERFGFTRANAQQLHHRGIGKLRDAGFGADWLD